MRTTNYPRQRRVPQVSVRRFVRAMRGHTKSWMAYADDGACYVVKFRNNPLGARVLVNELYASSLAATLGLPTPLPKIVAIPEGLSRPSGCSPFTEQHDPNSATLELAFGSQLPGNPTTSRIYDRMPTALLNKVSNLRDAVGVFTFDVWTGHSERRQFVFVQDARFKQSEHYYRMSMIDNEACFGGTGWHICSLNCQIGFWERTMNWPRNIDQAMGVITAIRSITLDQLVAQARAVPDEWLDDNRERAELFHLCDTLKQRAAIIEDLVATSIAGRVMADSQVASRKSKSI